MLGCRRALGSIAAEQQERLVAVSASECTDSASIDDDAVNRNATNLVTAMPRLANIAVTTALTLPSVPRKTPYEPGLKQRRDA